MSIQLVSAPPTTAVVRAGYLCTFGAIVGVVGGLSLAVLEPVVGEESYSYPTGPVEFILFQLAFAVNHVLLLVGVLAVGWAGAYGQRRPGKVGEWIAVVSLAVFTLLELIAATQAYETYPTPVSPLLDIGYPALTIGLLVGLMMLGVSVARERRWWSWRRWTPLATGLALGLLALPGLSIGFVWARIGISAWVATFIALGIALVVEGKKDEVV